MSRITRPVCKQILANVRTSMSNAFGSRYRWTSSDFIVHEIKVSEHDSEILKEITFSYVNVEPEKVHSLKYDLSEGYGFILND